MLYAIAQRKSITADMIAEGFRAFSGRLSIVERDGKVALDYCTGQYFPTEYRAAACAVCASILWTYWRDGAKDSDAVRKIARNALGRGIASRWFR